MQPADKVWGRFRWYEKAKICYAYLDDMPAPGDEISPTAIDVGQASNAGRSASRSGEQLAKIPRKQLAKIPRSARLDPTSAWRSSRILPSSQEHLLQSESEANVEMHEKAQLSETTLTAWNWKAFRESRWFTRGWTLQEMIAPKQLRFYNKDWVLIGALSNLADQVADITGVHSRALKGQWPIASFSIAQRMCWAADRETTRAEDRAYSLLGIFDISMPVIYGEGERAFLRLQQELLRVYSDQTIFAWSFEEKKENERSNTDEQALFASRGLTKALVESKKDVTSIWRESHLLAPSPKSFKGCERMVPIEQEQPHRSYQVTNREVSFELPIYSRPTHRLSASTQMRAVLNCCLEDDPTKVIDVKLVQVRQTIGSYYIGGEGPRVSIADFYDIAPRCTLSNFSVLLSVDRAQKRERVFGHHIVVCRIKEPKGPGSSGLRISQATPVHAWNEESSFFILPAKAPAGPKKPFASREFDAFDARISIWNDERNIVFADLRIRDDIAISIEYQKAEQSKSRLHFFKSMNKEALAVSFSQKLALSAKAQRKQMFQENVNVVELEVVSMSQAARLLWMFTIGVLLNFALLPATVIIPILTLYGIRNSGYEEYVGDKGPKFDQREVVGLGAGVTFACAASAFVLLSSDSFLPRRLSRWKFTMPWILSLATLSLCAVYDRHANRNREAVTSYRFSGASFNPWKRHGPGTVSTVVSPSIAKGFNPS